MDKVKANKDVVVEQLAKVGFNAFMADGWDDLPVNGIEQGQWIRVASVMLDELQRIWETAKT